MKHLASEIVDNLIEGRFSDEDMAGFATAASYVFNWSYRPYTNGAEPPAGTYRLTFKVLSHASHGGLTLTVDSIDQTNRVDIRFNMDIDVESPGRAVNFATSRQRGVVILWEGIDALKNEFEEWIKGPVTVLLVNKRLTRHTLSSAITKFLNKIAWVNKVQRATPEEINQIKQRFEYGEEKGPESLRHNGMFEDPRVEGRETDYEYLTSEDVRFWNMLADEYESRNRAK